MRDLIDERNERERISRSIIKYWNVNYVPLQLEAQEEQETEEPAGQLLSVKDMDNLRSDDYREEKESRMDEVTQGQIEKILHEKSEHIRKLFDSNGEL